ncbi:MAG: class I SAM-dependent methyltransferase, partial [Candidatus Nanopelagicales bacterium]|nr:class I SAM-dependent methyltransferase [Candidatus Nanopelagicales bacterium]
VVMDSTSVNAKDLLTFCENWNTAILTAESTTVNASVLRLLSLCAALTNASAAVEVGAHNGTTGLALFEGMAEEGILTSVEPDPEQLRLAKESFVAAEIPHGRTRLIAADPHEVLTRLTDGHYDLFLSADKPADHAAFAEQAERLLRPGGIAIFLNVADAADPAKREPEQLAVRQFTELMHGDEKWLTTLLPLADGVLIAVLRP